MMEAWWSERYKLPPNHPLFRHQSLSEILEEFLMVKAVEKQQLERDLESGDLSGEQQAAVKNQILHLDAVLEGRIEVGTGDPLADFWEAQIEAGLEPDLDLTLDDLRRLQQ